MYTHYTTHIAGQSPHKVFYKYTLILILDYWKQLHGDSEVESKVAKITKSSQLRDPPTRIKLKRPIISQCSSSSLRASYCSGSPHQHATIMLIDRMQPPC